MDSFLTQLFDEPQCSTELLGEDPWVFSCKCNKYCSSNNYQAVVEVRPAIVSVARNDLKQALFVCGTGTMV